MRERALKGIAFGGRHDFGELHVRHSNANQRFVFFFGAVVSGAATPTRRLQFRSRITLRFAFGLEREREREKEREREIRIIIYDRDFPAYSFS